jgi:two-component system, LytTR family, response regulator
MITAVIIDDTESSRISLADDVERYCQNVTLIGQAESVKTGVKLINSLKPQVIFLDVQLGDGTGFDILQQIEIYPYQVIFTTGSDDHAFKAIKFSAVDYLLKPVDPDELVAAVSKVKTVQQDISQDNIRLLLENLKNTKSAPKRIALSSADRIHVVNVDEIIRCESQRNYTLFFLQGGRQILVTRTLKEFEEMLEPHGFIRIHHSHLINPEYLREFIKADGGYALMSDGSRIPVAVRKKDELLRFLGV